MPIIYVVYSVETAFNGFCCAGGRVLLALLINYVHNTLKYLFMNVCVCVHDSISFS